MSQIALTGLPGVVLGEIVEKLDLFSILKLRKVCHNLRNFIDQFKPKSNFNEIYVEFSYLEKVIWRFGDEKENSETIEFKSDGNSCIVIWETDKMEKKEKILENSNNLDVFLRDFEDVMKYHQRKFLENLKLHVHADQFGAKILKSLQKMVPLRVTNLNLYVWGPGQLQDILSCIQPGILESIDFATYGSGHSDKDDSEFKVVDLEEISKMEQWKNVKSVNCYSDIIPSQIQHFLHFERITVGMGTVPYTEMVLLKEKMKTSRTLQEFCIHSDHITDVDNLDTVFGAPYKAPGTINEEQWFFKFQNLMEILRLVITDRGRITFDRVLEKDVLKNVELRN